MKPRLLLSTLAALAAAFSLIGVAGATPAGQSSRWLDTVIPPFTTTQVGTIGNVALSTIVGGGTFTAITPNGLTGGETIAIDRATYPAGGPVASESAGIDVCTPCSAVDPAGATQTGTIEMRWLRVNPGLQVAVLEHGTGGLANLRGVLTHPTGEYDGFIHWDGPCLSGVQVGPLVVPDGTSVCVDPGTTVVGPTSVEPGGELFADGASFVGPVTSNAASTLSLCGSRVTGSLTVDGSTGMVLAGEPSLGSTCPGNTIIGPAELSGNLAGLDFSGNTIIGPATVTNNSGGFMFGSFSANKVLGPLTNTNNS